MMPDENDFGERVKFEVGDSVKVWYVFGHPVGTVEEVRIDPEKKPIFYLVKYIYPETGDEYVEEFEGEDLTLHSRRRAGYSMVCECGSESDGGRHTHYCPKRSIIRG